MAKMNAALAAVLVMEKEGVSQAFGVPGAAINPLYAALRKHGGISHILARHVEGASHMAEGYTRAHAGNIGVCIGTSGPAGTDMITGLYSAIADSIPILCITGQAPRAPVQRRFSGGRHRDHQQARHQMERNGARASASASRFSAGFSSDALGPPWSSPD
jgi:glyoxylate carboligase